MSGGPARNPRSQAAQLARGNGESTQRNRDKIASRTCETQGKGGAVWKDTSKNPDLNYRFAGGQKDK